MLSMKEKKCDNSSRACVVYLRQNSKEELPCEGRSGYALQSAVSTSSVRKNITAYHLPAGKTVSEKHSSNMDEDSVNSNEGMNCSKMKLELSSVSKEETSGKESGVASMRESSSSVDENDNKKNLPAIHFLKKYHVLNTTTKPVTGFILTKDMMLKPVKPISENQEHIIDQRDENIWPNPFSETSQEDVEAQHLDKDGNVTTLESRAVCRRAAARRTETDVKELHCKSSRESVDESVESFYSKIIPNLVHTGSKRGRPPKQVKSDFGVSNMSRAVVKKRGSGRKIKLLRPVHYRNVCIASPDNGCLTCEERNSLSDGVDTSPSTAELDFLTNEYFNGIDKKSKQHLIYVMFDLPNEVLDTVLEYCGFNVFEAMLVLRHLQSGEPSASLQNSYKLVKQHLTVCRKSAESCQCWFGMLERRSHSIEYAMKYAKEIALMEYRNVMRALRQEIPVAEGNNEEQSTEDPPSALMVYSDPIQSDPSFGSVFRESLELGWGLLYGSYVMESFGVSSEFVL